MAMFVREERVVGDWVYASLLIIALLATACDVFGNPAESAAASTHNARASVGTHDDASSDRIAADDAMVECAEADAGEEFPCPAPLDANADRVAIHAMLRLHGRLPLRARTQELACETAVAGTPDNVAIAALPPVFAKR